MGMGKKKPSKSQPLTIEIEQGPSGSWFWRLRSPNNRILAFSEMYSSHHAAERAAKMVWDHMRPSTVVIDRMTDTVERGGCDGGPGGN